MGAGFRYSSYGPKYNPGPDYWLRVGQEMADRFPDAHPEAIWIVGVLYGKGTWLSFPGESTDKLIAFGFDDENEAALDLFDKNGVKVWLQVEPGDADMLQLIDLVLDRYSHHPCVIGFGVDLEWHHSSNPDEGVGATDEEAAQWLAAIRRHNPEYRLFLKHWLSEKMPETLREGILFVNDSQGFESLDQMVADFSEWGQDLFRPLRWHSNMVIPPIKNGGASWLIPPAISVKPYSLRLPMPRDSSGWISPSWTCSSPDFSDAIKENPNRPIEHRIFQTSHCLPV